MRATALGKWERQICFGIPVLFIGGIVMYPLYTLCGECFFLGFFVPVNHSTGEQMKLLLWPVVLWWSIHYMAVVRFSRHRVPDAPAWFAGALAALVTSQVTALLLYYGYTGALGVSSPVADGAILFVGIVTGQAVGFRVFRRGSGASWVLPVVSLVLLIAASVVFTLAPPDIPLFTDPHTGTRGIFCA